MILPKKFMLSKHQNKMILAIMYIIEVKFLSDSDDLSGLLGSISHDDLNSLDGLDSLFDLKNASTLDTEWFSWPQPPGQPLFNNPNFL